MMMKSCCQLLLLISLNVLVLGGYPGVVDDDIWHHVVKVLSKEHGGSKILLGHPEKAHLVDAYTKVTYHDPYHYGHHGHHYGHGHGIYEGHHHHSHGHGLHHHHSHGYKAPIPVLVGHYGPPPYHGHGHGHYHKK